MTCFQYGEVIEISHNYFFLNIISIEGLKRGKKLEANSSVLIAKSKTQTPHDQNF